MVIITTCDEGSEQLINNRQNGRRRGRGTGAPRPNGGGGGGNGVDRGNRIDNRARGNASQLHEKYKTLARDAQMQGDRVLTEYYLQFADHYFRVLAETRSRFDEQRPAQQRDRFDGNDFDDDGEDMAEDRVDERQPPRQPERADRQDRPQERQDRDRGERPQERGDRPERQDRPERFERPERAERQERPERREPRAERQPEPSEAREYRGNGDNGEAPTGEERPRRGRRPRVQVPDGPDADGEPVSERIELDRLPPSFMAVSASPVAPANDATDDEPAPKPRRIRRPRATDGAVVDG